MIQNIGIDILENKRIEKSINDDFLNMTLTKKELEIYNSKKGKKKLEFLCGRIACKEAIIKCLNEVANPHYLELEILNKENGAPYTVYKNYNIKISISHEDNYTIAQAIFLK